MIPTLVIMDQPKTKLASKLSPESFWVTLMQFLLMKSMISHLWRAKKALLILILSTKPLNKTQSVSFWMLTTSQQASTLLTPRNTWPSRTNLSRVTSSTKKMLSIIQTTWNQLNKDLVCLSLIRCVKLLKWWRSDQFWDQLPVLNMDVVEAKKQVIQARWRRTTWIWLKTLRTNSLAKFKTNRIISWMN